MRMLNRRPGHFHKSRAVAAAPLRVLALLVGGFVSSGAVAAGVDGVDIDPDAAGQAIVNLVVDGGDPAQQHAALDRLARLKETSPEQFVCQVVYFASRARNTKQAMAAGVIMRRLEVPEET